jgi:HK97 gp10 family phage protein
MAEERILGLADLKLRMNGLSDRLLQKKLRPAVRRGANVIRAQARENFNTGAGPNDITEALKASIRVTPRRGTPTRVVISVVAGDLTGAQIKKFGKKAAFYALWVEKGHINRAAGQALRGSKAGVRAARAASTNNTPAHPYMQPALEAKAQEAIDITIQAVADGLQEIDL